MNIALVLIWVSVLIFLAHAFALIFKRTKIPDVLWLVLIGIVIGPLMKIVTPADFGAVGKVFLPATLVVILFEGGIGLKLSSLVKAMRESLLLSVINFFTTMIIVGIATFLLTDLGILSAFMLGAILGGTSSAVVIPLVRQLKLKDESSATLLLESVVTDVLSVVVALALLEALKLGKVNIGLTVGHVISSFVLAAVVGIVGAVIWSVFLSKVRAMQDSIFTTPAFVFVIFGILEIMGFSGYVGALVFGITIGNIEIGNLLLKKTHISFKPVALTGVEKMFFSEIVFLLKTMLFVYMGVSLQLTNHWWIYVGLILSVLILLQRIPVVRFLVPKSTPRKDASLMAVIVPQGATAAVLASFPVQQGIAGGELIQSVAFAVVLFSIIFTSVLVFLLEKTAFLRFYGQLFPKFGTLSPPSLEAGPKSTDKDLRDTSE